MGPMAASEQSRRWSVLPRLLAQAPPRVLIVVGAALGVLGLLIVSKPLTSLVLLGVYVGISAIASGIIELVARHRSPTWWSRPFALAWIALGLLVLFWLGRSLNLLPTVLAILLLLGGFASLGDAVTRKRARERVRVSWRLLTAVWGVAQLVFGFLSLTWPDVTVLVVAVVFGLRTVVFGGSMFLRGLRLLMRRADRGGVGVGRPARPTRRWIGDLGRYALVALLVSTMAVGGFLNSWLQAGAPVVDAFYDPPATLPVGHGQLIRVGDYGGQIPSGATVSRILYTTTDTYGAPLAASALVIVPETSVAHPLPIVLWNHGTTGVARGCAPSLREDAATRWSIPALDQAIAHDWIVVAPDYAGQGAPGVFPYLIGEGEARSALDAVLAAQRMPGVWASDDVVVWGHSQGGHAALWSSMIAKRYAPGLNDLGTAALAPAGDPLALARDLTAGYASVQLTLLTAWVLVPYSETYPDVNIVSYVSPGARDIVREMAQRCPTEPGVLVSVAAALGVSEDTPLYIGDLTAGAMGQRLAQNAAIAKLPSPTLIAWGGRDEVIPRSQQVAYVKRLCARGNDLQWSEIPALGHQEILQPPSPFLPKLVDWTAGRFAHRAAPVSDCR